MKWTTLVTLVLVLSFTACGSSNATTDREASLKESMEKKNRMSITLLDQIRRLPGVTLRNGVPVFIKNNNTFSDNTIGEPLYVLNDYVVGSSFRSVNQLVQNVNVDKIETFTGPEAAIYGSRGANGVIKITTIQ